MIGALLAALCLVVTACGAAQTAPSTKTKTPPKRMASVPQTGVLKVTAQVTGTVSAPPVPGHRWLVGIDLISATDGYLLSSRYCGTAQSTTCTDLLMTSDGGADWQTVARDVPVTYVQFVSAQRGYGVSACSGDASACLTQILTTTDGGKTWTTVGSVASSFGNPSIAVLPDGNGLVASGSDVFATVNGRSPSEVFVCPDRDTATSVAFAGSGSRYVICAAQPGAGQEPKTLYASLDGGGFQKIATLPTGGYAILGSLYFANNASGILSLQRGGLWRTSNGGHSFQFESYVSGFAGATWANDQQGLVIQAASVLSTTDGGKTLHQIYPTLLPSGPLSMADAETGIAAQTAYNGSVLLQTTDGGALWQQIGQFGPVYLDRVSRTILYATSAIQGGLYRSTDGGITWTQLSVEGVPVFVSFPTPEIGYVDLEANHLLRTTDGGSTWTEVPTGQRVWNASFLDARRGFALTTPGTELVETVGGGRRWTSVATNPAWTIGGIDVVGSENVFIYATRPSADGSLTGLLLRSSDGGVRWTSIALSTPLANVDFVSATLGFAEAGGGIVRTEDGGVTWSAAR